MEDYNKWLAEVMEECSLPEAGDNPFDPTELDFNSPWVVGLGKLRNFDDAIYARSYREAADLIVESLDRIGPGYSSDRLSIPVMYLYRHCVELKLKALLQHKGWDVFESVCRPPKKPLGEHNIEELWRHFQRMNSERAELEKEEVERENYAGAILANLHEIDKGGQALRYSFDKKGNRNSENYPSSMNLQHLKMIVKRLYFYLEGYEAFLDDIQGNSCEHLSYR